MKIPSRLIVLLAIIMTMAACDKPKLIPEDKLEAIITDALLINSVISTQNTELEAIGMEMDSTDYYSDILRNHKYTLDDFRYTISEMTARKSNPLEDILETVVETINSQASKVEYRYNAARKFDSIAIAAYRDTLYYAEKKTRGSLRKYRIELTDQLKKGDYELSVDYISMSDYRYPQKSAKWYFADTTDTKKPRHSTIWLTRASKEITLTHKFSLSDPTSNSLVIYFAESPIAKRYQKLVGADTSYISNVLVTYTPPIEIARATYFNSLYGKDFVLNRNYDTLVSRKIRIPYNLTTK